jgi:DNA-binding NtrC family response regulator
MGDYRIMIVDGETAILELLRRSLELSGYNQVETYARPEIALEMLAKRKYHVVLADIMMPETDGIEFLKKVREYDPLAQVIVMAGRSTMDSILTCLELGANEYVLKPFKSSDDVLELVDYSIKKLERWREAIRGLLQNG